jgi:hydrogenase-4 component E
MHASATVGVLSYDMAHLLGGATLVLSFVLLYQRRLNAAINVYTLQSLVLAAAAAWQGWVQSAPQLYLTALIALGANVVAIPIALRRILDRLSIRREIETALGIVASMILGLALVALVLLAVPPGAMREDLSFAFSVVLLGMLTMITRRNALAQVVGFLSLENGLILAIVGIAGMPLVVELSTAVLVLVALVVFGVFFLRIRERFDSADVSPIDRLGEAHR